MNELRIVYNLERSRSTLIKETSLSPETDCNFSVKRFLSDTFLFRPMLGINFENVIENPLLEISVMYITE